MELTLKCQSLVLKVASRCNLNCTYCYMYNLGDNTYKNQPKFMSNETVDAIINKVWNHCVSHNIHKFEFVFHGGEPLLATPVFYKYFVSKSLEVLSPKIKVGFLVQTNGVLLTDEWCDILGELKIPIGISLDGTKEANDMYRIDHKGKGSYNRIVKGLKIAQKSKAVSKPGALSVINILSDPIEVYKHFKTLDVTHIDFLLPDNTYDNLPTGFIDHHNLNTPYANWLISIFEEWFYDKGKKPKIRLFETIIVSLLGIDASIDTMGKNTNDILVIETDGGIEPIDSMKACGEGFTKIGANIKSHEIDEALQTDLAKLYNLSHKILPQQCQKCPVSEICGGGYLTHRFSKSNGFNNPSIYCKDLLKMITHIQNTIIDQIPTHFIQRENITKVVFEDVLNSFSRTDNLSLAC